MKYLSKLFILMLLFPAIASTLTKEPVIIGKILRIKGDVKITSGGKVSQAGYLGNLLGGDKITTGKSGEMSLSIQGHIIDLRPDSQLRVDEQGAERGLVFSAMLDGGIIYIKSKPAAKPGEEKSSLHIQTPTCVAGLRGTKFVVAVAPDLSTRIGVEDGQVDVISESGKKIILSLRDGIEIDGLSGKLSASQYLPEIESIENWFEKKKAGFLLKPATAIARLTNNLNLMINNSEKLVQNIANVVTKATEDGRNTERYRTKGQMPASNQYRSQVGPVIPEIEIKIRTMIWEDNRIQQRWYQINWMLQLLTASDAQSSKGAVLRIKAKQNEMNPLEPRANKIHQERARILNVLIPDYKDAIKFVL